MGLGHSDVRVRGHLTTVRHSLLSMRIVVVTLAVPLRMIGSVPERDGAVLDGSFS